MTRWPQSAQPTADEALTALTLLASLRDWLARIEPRLIDAARAQGVTWEALAGVLRVGDRRADQRRASRLARASWPAHRNLPADNRPLPDVAKYDELLPSRRRPHPPVTAADVPAGPACPSVYPECPPGDQHCVRTGGHPGPSAVHYNRAGFGWTDDEAAASAAPIRRTSPT